MNEHAQSPTPQMIQRAFEAVGVAMALILARSESGCCEFAGMTMTWDRDQQQVDIDEFEPLRSITCTVKFDKSWNIEPFHWELIEGVARELGIATNQITFIPSNDERNEEETDYIEFQTPYAFPAKVAA